MSERITLSIDPELAAGIREAAEAEGMSVSGWMARSALRSLKNRNLLTLISEYEREHGEITDDELQRAERAWQASR